MIVTVTPEDFGTEDVLAGVAFQQKLEKLLIMPEMEGYRYNCLVILQKQSFFQGRSDSATDKGDITWTNIRQIFPEVIADALEQGILMFDRKLKAMLTRIRFCQQWRAEPHLR